jgi:5-oxoprolinase (ATP-hydrolysing)
MGLADVCQEASEPSSEVFSHESLPHLRARLETLKAGVRDELLAQEFVEKNLRFEVYLNMRYQGTDTAFMIMEPKNGSFEEAFLARQMEEFSFIVPGRPILVDDLRVRGIATDGSISNGVSLGKEIAATRSTAGSVKVSSATVLTDVYYDQIGRVSTPVYKLSSLSKGTAVPVSHTWASDIKQR